MSVNHYTEELHNHTNNVFSNSQNDSVYNNQNQYDAVRNHEEVYEVRVGLFEKSLTPSDVGKLNRLVIPKQHAEKHFPLNNLAAAAGEVSTTEEKGPALMLSFEDESTGKNWEFRYSYWNSSQSYVLTKGWSRYVKHKHLDAGDVIFFKRHRYDLHRLFIGWRRRSSGGEPSSSTLTTSTSTLSSPALLNTNTTTFWNGVMPYHQIHVSNAYSNPLILPEYSHYGGAVEGQSTPTGTASSRTVRLFGVNLECEQLNDAVSAEEPPYPDADGYQGQHNNYYYSTPHRMNISFGGETMEQVRR